MNSFKSMSLKVVKNKKYTPTTEQKQSDGWLRLNPRHTAGIEKLG